MQSFFLVLIALIANVFTAAAQQTDTLFIFFSSNISSLRPEQEMQLDSVAKIAAKGHLSSIRIYGYTDQTGLLKANLDLSVKRAKEVRKRLLKSKTKLPPGIITETIGKGAVKAEANAGESSMDYFRRVEIITETRAKETNYANLKAGSEIILQNLDFVPGKHIVTPQSVPVLEKLLEVMRQNPTLKVQVQGHICCQNGTDGLDTDTGKNELSVNRAKFVYNYLIKNGIEPNRLSYRGFGRTRPLADPELTDQDRQLNRRVEIRVVSR